MQITYKDETHQYWIDGIECRSVSTRLKDEGFYKHFEFVPNIEYYLTLGRAYHKVIQLHLTNNLKKFDPMLQPYLDGAIKYLKDVDAEILGVEEMVGFLPMLTAGRMDLRARIRGVIKVVDWKRSFSKPYPLQLAGYRFLWNISRPEEEPIEGIEAVMLDGKGGYSLAGRDKYPPILETAFVSLVNWQNSKGMFI